MPCLLFVWSLDPAAPGMLMSVSRDCLALCRQLLKFVHVHVVCVVAIVNMLLTVVHSHNASSHFPPWLTSFCRYVWCYQLWNKCLS